MSRPLPSTWSFVACQVCHGHRACVHSGRGAPGVDDGTAEIAARVASGPGFWTQWLAELGRPGLLEELLAGGVIARALREAPSGHKYDRVLTAKMTAVCVLVACLFPGAGYDAMPGT